MSTVLEGPTSPDLGARRAPPVPAARQSRFNRGYLDRTDPVEGSGLWMKQFSFALNHRVDVEKLEPVVRSLYDRVYTRLKGDSIPHALPDMVEYDDARTGKVEAARRYIVVRGDTARSTHMDVFATFRVYGDYLYVSVDSFVLPRLSILRLLWAFVVALGVTLFAWLYTTSIVAMLTLAQFYNAARSLDGPMPGFLFVTCPVMLWWNREVIRSVVHGDPLLIAIRRRYHRWGGLGAFDNDDILAYFKGIVSLIAEEIGNVFNEYGIPVTDLRQIQQTINLTNSVINNGAMAVAGSVLVGMGNALTGERS